MKNHLKILHKKEKTATIICKTTTSNLNVLLANVEKAFKPEAPR